MLGISLFSSLLCLLILLIKRTYVQHWQYLISMELLSGEIVFSYF
ncbi:hypothetical protein PORCAN_449 [Porphyromonas crevioricanis JCM 13913]|nr:hypothetical protein PORCAN_449 [Porphyromonas crevioricanis JCM 13913]